MARRRKHAPAVAVPARKARYHDPEVRHEILREFGLSIAGTILLSLLIFVFFEKSALADATRWVAFRFVESSSWFQSQTTDGNPVPAIVDISNLHPDAPGAVTSRKELKAVLRDLICPGESRPPDQPAGAADPICRGKASPGAPAAIGIDIDFSPESPSGWSGTESVRRNWQFVDPQNDPGFFNACINLDVPVFLGVYRTIQLPPDQWLGLAEYQRLAAALPIEENPEHILETTRDSPTFAWALAQAYKKRTAENASAAAGSGTPQAAWLREFFLERRTETSVLGVGKSIIDYRALKGIQVIDRSNVRNQQKDFAGRIVIIGDVHPALREAPLQDLFEVPSEIAKSAGARVQAAAAYTMISPQGLLMLRRPWEVTADVILAFALHSLIAMFRLASRKERHELKALSICFVAGGLIVFLIALMVSRWILWDGCLVVAITLTIEPVWHLATTKFVQVSWSGIKHVGRKS